MYTNNSKNSYNVKYSQIFALPSSLGSVSTFWPIRENILHYYNEKQQQQQQQQQKIKLQRYHYPTGHKYK